MQKDKEYMLEALEEWHPLYDKQEKMIYDFIGSPVYHTRLREGKAHHTRESLIYAVALLDSGYEEYRERAVDILEKVVGLQDTDPASETFGIWSWYYEEPLEEMSPPDWNWADFCSKELIQVALDHANRIPGNLYEKIKKSIIYSCMSIVCRDVSPGYTNIAIMGSYVTIKTGELFNIDCLLKYGKNKLCEIQEDVRRNGTFNEYNSPTYTIVAVEELSRIMLQVKDEECLKIAEELNDKAWKIIGEHFHYKSRQWAGPHSRCYNNLRDKLFLSRIQLASRGKIRLLDEGDIKTTINWPRVRHHCPDKYIGYFSGPGEQRFLREKFDINKGFAASTYLDRDYTIGSFNKSIMWNQRRPLIAYWGDYRSPSYLQLRCLHDGYDYSSAVFHSVQRKNYVLGALNFSTDGGDTHCGLDRLENASIDAEDLRLRFEFGGSIGSISLPSAISDIDYSEEQLIYQEKTVIGRTIPGGKPDGKTDEKSDGGKVVKVSFEGFNIYIIIPYVRFADNEILYEMIENNSTGVIDVIFYKGRRKTIDFSRIEEAVCSLGVCFVNKKDDININKITAFSEEGKLYSRWDTPQGEMKLMTDAEPAKLADIMQTE